MKPPRLTVAVSFREAYVAGRFQALDLIRQAALKREATKHRVHISGDTLEWLDKSGVFTPIAFASPEFRPPFFGFGWSEEGLTFREEVGFRPWSRYRFRDSDGFKRVEPLYSPWQLMYLKSAVEEGHAPMAT